MSEKKSLFIHVPRTSGSNVIASCCTALGIPDLPAAATRRIASLRSDSGSPLWAFGHCRPAALLALGCVTRDEFDARTVFTIIRSPWTRIPSIYRYELTRRRSCLTSLARRKNKRRWTQEGFLQWLREYKRLDADLFLAPDGRLEMADPLVYWLNDASGRALVDNIFRYESLPEEWRNICHLLNLPESTSLGSIDRDCQLGLSQQRTQRDAEYAALYTTAAQEIIAKRCARDIDIFGYEFPF